MNEHHPLYFFHGLESSPEGFRANYLRERYPEIRVPALPKDPRERHRILLAELTEPALVVGSSLGGLSALMMVRDVPRRIAGMVLLAPAVGFHDATYRTPEVLALVSSLAIPPGIPTVIIAATRDEVIPLEAIERLVARSPEAAVRDFVKVDDQHRLHSEAALSAMLAAIEQVRAEVQDVPANL
ncbi:Alpha/beta hydrolase [Sulfidibacter corallicola]|uniref:Alpha/beta hydrolase n=1 Tax=Sulfidibacter corallicola TaxID=2818388 RepID=A0A8A4TNV6_SULCO|nr:YqiA/YcfP family alpha/beta fold hydrolase [Sulfidibacter corallicola]QTD50782.1 alpha/beta hydrolase [Sulfidibacter corallicola]